MECDEEILRCKPKPGASLKSNKRTDRHCLKQLSCNHPALVWVFLSERTSSIVDFPFSWANRNGVLLGKIN